MKISADLKENILSGFWGAMLFSAYYISACAVAGTPSLMWFLPAAIICAVFSVKENGVFAPHPFLLVPALFVLGNGNYFTLILSTLLGAFLFFVFKKVLKNIKIPDFIIAGGGVALALSVTILLTNNYFGIGASGAEPLEMLKSYRSLGFHPNFSGLLYGTVTLFAMITYPFKFKKLNKYIPAEFITLLIPLVMNLCLNPTGYVTLTTVNEISTEFYHSFINFDEFFSNNISLSLVFKGGFCVACILFAFFKEQPSTLKPTAANITAGLIGGFSVKKYSNKNFNFISAIAFFSLISIFMIFHNTIARLPIHCAGAMLIVSAWQGVPYKKVACAFKKEALLSLISIVAICTVAIAFGIFAALIFCILATFIQEKRYDKR